jgi:hypothetical protein
VYQVMVVKLLRQALREQIIEVAVVAGLLFKQVRLEMVVQVEQVWLLFLFLRLSILALPLAPLLLQQVV